MFLADVVGTVVSPVQIPILDGEKLLLLRPLTPDGRPGGKTRIGIDRAGGDGAAEPVEDRAAAAAGVKVKGGGDGGAPSGAGGCWP